MSAGRIVGGILALVAGALLLIALFWAMARWGLEFNDPIILWNLAVAALIIVGGILGLAKVKIAGGILALVGGGLSILGSLLFLLGVLWYFMPLSFFYFIIATEFTYVFALEAIIAIVGGIILLVSSKE